MCDENIERHSKRSVLGICSLTKTQRFGKCYPQKAENRSEGNREMSYGVVGGLAAPPLNVNANSSLSSCVCFWVVSPFSFYVFLSLSNDNDSDVVAADFCNF